MHAWLSYAGLHSQQRKWGRRKLYWKLKVFGFVWKSKESTKATLLHSKLYSTCFSKRKQQRKDRLTRKERFVAVRRGQSWEKRWKAWGSWLCTEQRDEMRGMRYCAWDSEDMSIVYWRQFGNCPTHPNGYIKTCTNFW